MLIGCGGVDGWVNYDIIQRKKKNCSMSYKDDMDGAKFETFLRETCSKLKQKYDKVALVMDKASYHTILLDNIPNSKWVLPQYKKFCTENNLKVIPTHSKAKKGRLVLADHKAAADKYVQDSGVKYKADEIMKSYGVRCIPLPPYHPELNPIERV